MKLKEAINFINQNPLLVTIVGGLIVLLISATIVGSFNFIKNRNFRYGFLILFKWLKIVIVWLFNGLIQVILYIGFKIKRLLIFIFKIPLKPVVIEILEDRGIGISKIAWSFEPITFKAFGSQSGDNCLFPDIFDLSNNLYEINIHNIEGLYWRIGFKLLKDLTFYPKIKAINMSFIHIIKNSDENFLCVDSHIKGCTHIEGAPIQGVYGEPIVLRIGRIEKQNMLQVYIAGKKSVRFNFDKKYKFAQLVAWGDGHPFKFDLFIKS